MIYLTFYDNLTDKPERTLGPFKDLQMTYHLLRSEQDEQVALLKNGVWFLNDTDSFTDFVIHTKEDV